MANPMFALKAPLMHKKNFAPNFPLKHAQKDMRFALGLGDQVSGPVLCACCYYVELWSSTLGMNMIDFAPGCGGGAEGGGRSKTRNRGKKLRHSIEEGNIITLRLFGIRFS